MRDSSLPDRAFRADVPLLVALVAPTGGLSALAAALVNLDVALRLSTVGSCSASASLASCSKFSAVDFALRRLLKLVSEDNNDFRCQ